MRGAWALGGEGAGAARDGARAPLAAAGPTLKGRGVRVRALTACGFPPCVFAHRHDLLELIDPLMHARFGKGERGYGAPCEGCAVLDR